MISKFISHYQSPPTKFNTCKTSSPFIRRTTYWTPLER